MLLLGGVLGAQLSLQRLEELRGSRDPVAILKELLEFEEKHPQDPAVLLGLAEVYASEGAPKNTRRARKLLRELIDLPESAPLKRLDRHEGGLRQRARLLLRDLKDDRRLWLVSTPRRMKRDLARAERAATAQRRKEPARAERVTRIQQELERWTIQPGSRERNRYMKKLRTDLEKAQRALQELQVERGRAESNADLLRGLLLASGAANVLPSPVDRALDWLVSHQQSDGKFAAASPTCHIGVTALCVLALVGDRPRRRSEATLGAVARAIDFLLKQQDSNTGLIGRVSARDFLYCHAMATQALVETMRIQARADIRPKAQKALRYIERARNPMLVWRYYPQDGDNDSSVTGWMTMALAAGRDAGLEVDAKVFDFVIKWFDQVTDPTTGRGGYTRRGQGSSRGLATLERDDLGDSIAKFPAHLSRAMTAVGLLSRLRSGETPRSTPLHELAAESMLAHSPRWDPAAGTIDFYYWMVGTHALSEFGGRAWSRWRGIVSSTLGDAQLVDGSWPASLDSHGIAELTRMLPEGRSRGRRRPSGQDEVSLEVD